MQSVFRRGRRASKDSLRFRVPRRATRGFSSSSCKGTLATWRSGIQTGQPNNNSWAKPGCEWPGTRYPS